MSAPYWSHHVLRRDDVAQRLRHLAALLVEREAVGQHAVVGRAAARAAALEQRGMEPAAMLVGALEIEVGRPVQLGIAARARRRGSSRNRTRRRGCPSPARSPRRCSRCRGSAAGGLSNQASAPSASKASATRLDHLGIAQRLAGLPCRRTPRSARPRRAGARRTSRAAARSCVRRRLLPARGTKRVASIAASAFSRRCRRSRRSACPWR